MKVERKRKKRLIISIVSIAIIIWFCTGFHGDAPKVTDKHAVSVYAEHVSAMNKNIDNRLSNVSSYEDTTQIKKLTDEYFDDAKSLAGNTDVGTAVADEQQVMTVYGQSADEFAKAFEKNDKEQMQKANDDYVYAKTKAMDTEKELKTLTK